MSAIDLVSYIAILESLYEDFNQLHFYAEEARTSLDIALEALEKAQKLSRILEVRIKSGRKNQETLVSFLNSTTPSDGNTKPRPRGRS